MGFLNFLICSDFIPSTASVTISGSISHCHFSHLKEQRNKASIALKFVFPVKVLLYPNVSCQITIIRDF